ncbi:MAG: 50S ribosomal protein L11 methyltransferase [Desulfobulbaceae bacterium]|nr:50S ribosomal protein L11 methyltransferase [Desulfobulbaceae bacterium]
MRLSESADGTGPVAIIVRVDGDEAVERLHQGLIELSRVEEVRCCRYAGGWLLTACGVANADPDPLLRTVGAVVDQFDSKAEVIDVRRGASELPAGEEGFRLSERFMVTGGNAAVDASTIRLDAAHVFGTGAHASTKLAVQAMEEVAGREEGFPARALDVGTGSGILALVAARLGGAHVLGIDICEEALAVAWRNILANGLRGQVSLASTPLAELTERYGMVIANVTASVLLRLAEGIVNRLESGGWLIVSGLQGRQGEEMEEALSLYGLQTVARYADGKWRCLTLRYLPTV